MEQARSLCTNSAPRKALNLPRESFSLASTDRLLSYYPCSRFDMESKRLLLIASVVLVLGLTSIAILPSLHFVSTAHATPRTFSLIGNYYYGWNYSQPSGPNPTITVNQGDTVMISLSSSDYTHQFALDVDKDGTMFTSMCPSGDTCSSMFSTTSPTSVSIPGTLAPGTYKYFCTFHAAMVGNFVVQATSTPNFSVSSNPSTLNIAQGATGTTTITLTSVNSFSGTITLAGSVSPSGPSVSFSPATLTVSGASATSTLTVSAAPMGLYSTPVSNGNYSVNITATSGSLSHSTTVQVTVGSTSSGSGALNLPVTVWTGIATVIIAVVAVTVYLVRRKTK